ncbi:MAG: DUF5611 family protein [archaeon]|nr:DUF5611 family protein [archaeon]
MNYDIKRGWMKNIEGNLLPNMMKEIFGNVIEQQGTFVSSYGVMAKIKVKILSEKVLDVTVENVADLQNKYSAEDLDVAIIDSKRNLNIFMERATGFNIKERKKRMQKR